MSGLGAEDSYLAHSAAPPVAQVEEAQVRRYIVTRGVSLHVNGVTIRCDAGQIVDSPAMIQRLLEMRAPITPIRNEDDIGTCPHCGKSFSLAAQRGARELLARARSLIPGYR